jgi:hypothetical protein
VQEVTCKAKLLARNTDSMGYTTYVFERFEFDDLDCKYVMCVRYPNWNQNYIAINDIGFLTVRYVEAGIDKWFDGKDFVPYNYTAIAFLKFIHEKQEIEDENIVVD